MKNENETTEKNPNEIYVTTSVTVEQKKVITFPSYWIINDLSFLKVISATETIIVWTVLKEIQLSGFHIFNTTNDIKPSTKEDFLKAFTEVSNYIKDLAHG